MARSSADACMVCYPDPCQCNVKKAATKRPRKRPAEEPPAVAMEPAEATPSVAPRLDIRARMKAAAAAAPPPPPIPPKPVRGRAPVPSDEDLLLNAAIRSLADVLHPEEKARWGMVATSTPSQAERAAEWKARRRWHQQQ